MPKKISSISVSIETVLNKLTVDRTNDEYREARDNIRTFFELLDRWDREHDVTVVSDISTIENCEHTEGGHNE